jgi:chromosome segregation ATPase
MFGSFASSRLALILRRLRGRFGISAPRVAVRTHLPWYWRALSVIMLSGASLALAGWIYDAGRQFAGFDQGISEQEIAAMRERVATLEVELESARKIANSSESRLRIESTSQERLAKQISTLEEENSRLKADLATFESLGRRSDGQFRLGDQSLADTARRRRTISLQPAAGPDG